MIVDASWYMLHTALSRDLQKKNQQLTVKKEIHCYGSQYNAYLIAHPNNLIVNLMEPPDNRQLQRHLPNYLSDF
jgi:hypothetical protein